MLPNRVLSLPPSHTPFLFMGPETFWFMDNGATKWAAQPEPEAVFYAA